MAIYKLKLPKMGEGVIEASITAWTKNLGDRIEEDDTIVEVATDKVDSEVSSEVSGILKERLFEEGDTVKIGETFAIIETDKEVETEEIIQNPEIKIEEETKKVSIEKVDEHQRETEKISLKNADRFYSPLVRNIAKSEGISAEELEQIHGTGKEGRVTKNDIFKYLENRVGTKQIEKKQMGTTISQPTEIESPSGIVMENGDEIIEMDRMRKLIAKHMLHSKQTSPHVQSFVEADVTRIVNWRNKIKDQFFKREGEKITFTPILLYFVVKTIKDYPMVNIQLDGDKIIKKKNINLGMAVALPNGNLIVPVIKNADQFSLVGLTKKVNDLAKRARENKLKPDEIVGGTYTVTNIGSFGNIAGTAIINQPQVAIMALGAIRKMPAVIETFEGDMIGIRQKMILSHSYDHRVVDGMLGGLFVKRLAEYLENFDGDMDI